MIKQTRAAFSLVAVAALLAACGQAQQLTPVTAGVKAERPVVRAKAATAAIEAPSEVIVASRDAQAPRVEGARAEESFTFAGTTYHLMSVSSKSLLSRVVTSLRRESGILRADVNPVQVALEAAPDDEFFPLQYGLRQKDVPTAWNVTRGDGEMVVAVVDTGIDYTHPDLKDRTIQGKDFSFRGGRFFNRHDKDGPMDDNAHGTHCAGIIGATANNATGIAGVAPNVKLLAVKVLSGKGHGTQYDVMKGVAYAITNGAKIVSMSLGGSMTTSVERQFYEAAVQSGALVVAAAGNDYGDGLGFPAAYPGVLSVGATDDSGAIARFSNHDASMGVTAPGVGILSTIPGNGYMKMSGTSMAAPFVSGVAALVWSSHPDWTAQQVKEHIERTATDVGAPGVDSVFGHGEVNVKAALGL